MWFALSVMIACNWDVSQENQGDPTAESQPAVLVDDAQVGTKLNLVWVVIDTLRADHVSLSGHRCGASNPAEKERKTTPNLDRLASQGAYALRAYSQSGWTLTSMASLLTGLYPHQHRVGRDPSDAAKFGRLQDDVTTFAEMLQGAGYATGAVVNNTFMAPEFRMNQGFDFYDYQGATNDKHRSAQDTVVAGLSWMNKQKDPAFLVVHFMEPHLEYRPPADILGTFSPTEIPAQLVEVAGKPSPSAALQMGLMEPTEETIDYLKARYDEESWLRIVRWRNWLKGWAGSMTRCWWSRRIMVKSSGITAGSSMATRCMGS